ncbi:nucleotidyltransferase family protein [Pararhizobium sp.]|uniref:nucleotidyltransferase family protein n=1 Tax=Pararhizobium sp. TaxID=1977563 RepID=UPI002D7FFD9E|nr:nucleotidyltransferase domain-containing protein [Pararhizobium sp.]
MMAIEKLQEQTDALRGMGATGLYLFGSTARGEASPTSDLDLFIDHEQNGRFSLIELAGMQQLLEETMDVRIDLTTRNSLHPALKTGIESSAVRIF